MLNIARNKIIFIFLFALSAFFTTSADAALKIINGNSPFDGFYASLDAGAGTFVSSDSNTQSFPTTGASNFTNASRIRNTALLLRMGVGFGWSLKKFYVGIEPFVRFNPNEGKSSAIRRNVSGEMRQTSQ